MIVEYHRPETLDEALDLLARTHPLTIPLGGGNILCQKKKPDFAVVDLQLLGLNKIVIEGQLLIIGATATLQQTHNLIGLSENLMASLRTCIEWESSRNRRQMATIAGTLVSCDSRSALTTALLALDARLIWAPGSELQSLGDFLPLRQPFGHEQLMLGVRITTNVHLRVDMVSRTPMDRPIVCAAVAIWPSGRTRVALGGHGLAPILAMDGPEPDGAIVAAQEAYRYSEDEWGSAAYRMDVAGRLVERLLVPERKV